MDSEVQPHLCPKQKLGKEFFCLLNLSYGIRITLMLTWIEKHVMSHNSVVLYLWYILLRCDLFVEGDAADCREMNKRQKGGGEAPRISILYNSDGSSEGTKTTKFTEEVTVWTVFFLPWPSNLNGTLSHFHSGWHYSERPHNTQLTRTWILQNQLII